MAEAEGEKKGAMAAAEGEKKGAMEAEEGEKQAMAAAKEAPVEEKRKGAEGAAAPEEEVGEAASEKPQEAKGVDGVKMITLQSADGEERSMPAAAAKISVVLSHMIEDASRVEDAIWIKHCATGRTLDTVIEYCVKHAAEPVNDAYSDDPSGGAEDLEKWDRKLVDGLSANDLYDLLLAANHLNIQGLLGVVCQRTADMIKGKTTQQIRATLNITYDLTPADEAEFLRRYAWSSAE
ncbi:unnamed protein product [Urochloa decumbens]|uniref:SKP1-like protein n=1 Tax=Urochloa decumbens TaxID=240449 RepID=A0ABC9GTQ7_9POAL